MKLMTSEAHPARPTDRPAGADAHRFARLDQEDREKKISLEALTLLA